MRKIDTHSTPTILTRDGLSVQGWSKVCPCCHHTYETTSRSQKFCSTDCNRKYVSRKAAEKKAYNETKEYHRLKSRSHSLAVEVVKLLGRTSCECCGSTTSLQVHHRDLRWLNNSPDNLQLLCPTCHSRVHSELEASWKEHGITYKSYYSQEEYKIYSQTLSNEDN